MKPNAAVNSFLRHWLLIGLMSGSAIAQTVPDLTNGGVPDHSNYINLGPTGMTGWMYRDFDPKSLLAYVNYTGASRQILVTAVDAGSPAVPAGIQVDDVILGASGDGSTPVDFTSDARKSLALAIAAAEARTTPELKLKIWRAGVTSTLTLTLQNLGAYGPDAPLSDAKCTMIAENARQALLANSDPGLLRLGTLALMALDDPNHPDHAAMKAQIDAEITAMLPDAATLAKMNSGFPETIGNAGWHRSHELIVLAEYYLTYGEHPNGGVFQAIEGYVNSITTGQSIFGTYGHTYAHFRWPDDASTPMMAGYGSINSASVPGMYGLMLAKQCNVINPKLDEGINRATTFFGSYAGRGTIPYGEHEPDPTEYSSNGKSASAALAFDLAQDKRPESEFFAKMSASAFKEYDTGHTGSYFQQLWSPLGAALAGDDAIKHYFAEVSWLYDLSRKWDGTFAYTPLYYLNKYSDFNPSAPYVMTYALPLKRLHMTGRGRSSAGILDATERAQAVFSGNYDETTRTKAQLIADLGNWSYVVRLRASNALAGMALTSTDIDTLNAMAGDPQGASRVGALMALEKIVDPSSATILSACLSDPDPHIRRLAGNALLVNPAKAGELNAVLAAAAAAERPVLPLDPRDPLHHDLFAIGKVLFTGNTDATKRGILYNSSLLKVDLTGVDRDLLYPAIRALAACPAGAGRSGMSGVFDALNETDVKVLGDLLVNTAYYRAPADPMFADTARAKSMDALIRYDFAEAIPVAERSIRADFFTNPNRNLYGEMFKDLKHFKRTNLLVTPDPDIVGLCQDFIATWGVSLFSADNAAEASLVLDAIDYDSHPAAPKYLKSFDWVVTDAVALTLPANQTQLHASVTDHAKGDLTYTWRKVYGAGEVTFSPNGTAASKDTSITFDNTPGEYLFEVTVIDSRGFSEIKGTVAMTLYDTNGNLPANLPPTAAQQSLTVAPGTQTPITLAGSDPENAPLVFTVTSQPAYGTLTGTAPNLSYISDLSYHSGQDSFTFEVTDSFGQTSSATVSITVDSSLLETYVYEPFDYPVGALLAGNAGGTGMTGTWLDGPVNGKAWIYDATTVTNPVNTGAGTYSWDGVVDNLPTQNVSGAKMVGLGAATGGDSYEIHRTLAQDAGTMAGSDNVLWASIAYHRASNTFAQHLGLALTTDCFTNSGRNLDTSGNHGSGAGNGIGVGRPFDVASSYNAVVFNGGSAVASTTAPEFASGDFVMVLKFEFGAIDKVSAYAFREHEVISESEFNNRAVVASAAIDESTLNRISVASGRGDPSFDEIRVGNSFAAVAGVAESGFDVTPPAPNPMTFAVAPTANATSISMTATTATDPSGVEYYFTCTSGGGKDSGWQDSPGYTDSNLNTSTEYTYTVMARDKSVNMNVTAPSAPASATTAGDVALVYEAFDYQVGELLGRNGGVGFAGPWADSAGTNFQGFVRDETTNVIFESTTLDWNGVLNNGFPSSPGAGSRYLSSDGQSNSGVDVKRMLASSAGAMAGADGVLWMSAVYRFPNGTSGASINIGLTDGGHITDRGRRTSSPTMDFIGVNGWNGSTAWNAQVNPTIIDSTTASNSVWDQYVRTPGGVNMNSTVDKIIVMKFTFGASDKVEAFWFDENTPMGSITESAFNAGKVGATYVTGIDENNLNTLVYSQGRFNNALDEIRMGNSFEEVIGLIGSTTPDTTPPTLASSDIVDDQGGGPVTAGSVVVYNVTFSEDIAASTVTPSDFSNAGTASGTIGTVVALSPSTYQVRFHALSTGTLQLRVNAGAVINDIAGNPLNTTAAILDDTIISVVSANSTPVWAANPVNAASAAEDANYNSTLANDASDADNDPLTFAKVSGPAWLNVAPDGTLSGTPTQSDVGENTFIVSVTDGIYSSVEATLNITVNYVNNVPIFIANPILGSNATEDEPYTATLAGSAMDEDGDTLTYSKVSGPSWLSVAPEGTLSGTPASGDVGANSFSVSVSDGIAPAVEATLNITVNAAPITNNALLVYEPFDYATGPLAGQSGGSGMNGVWADGPESNGIAGIFDETTATTPVNRSGSLSWDGVVNNLPTSPASGARYVALNDTAGDKWEAYRSLSQDAGTMAGPGKVLWLSMAWHKAGSGWGQHVGIALTTDSFKDRGKKLDTTGSHGSGAGNGIGVSESSVNSGKYSAVVFNGGLPAAITTSNAYGSGSDKVLVLKFEFGEVDTVSAFAFGEDDTLTEIAFNDSKVSASASVDESTLNMIAFTNVRGEPAFDEIRIGSTFESVIGAGGPANTAPSWANNPIISPDATEDAPYAATLAGSATDADGDPLSFAKLSGPAWLEVATDGSLTGTPTQSDVGANDFTVSVSDGIAPAVEATLSITVVNVNDAPIFSANPIIGADATEDEPYTATLAGSATDEDGDPLIYAKVSGPAWLGVATNGAISGTPTQSDVGANAFTISVSDGIAPPVEATLSITVTNVNDTPVFAANPITGTDATKGEPYAATLAGSATDEDGDPLAYTKVSGPAWLSVAANGSLTGAPTSGDVGLNSFTVSASDGIAPAVEATLSITVITVNDAPVFAANPINGTDANEDEPYTATLAGTATDENNDPLTFAKVSGPAWLTVAPDGTLAGTPYSGDVGVNSFTITVTDGIAPPVEAALAITVIASSSEAILTIHSGQNLGGTSASIPNTHTIYSATAIPGGLDNQISSFLLKQGHMAVVATQTDGLGSSKVFIASEADLTINSLPSELDNQISFIRVMPWKNTLKKGLAGGDQTHASQLNGSWYYNWGASLEQGQAINNHEFVPMSWGHGGADPDDITKYLQMDQVTHLLAFNEPDDCNAQSGQWGGMCQVSNAVAYYVPLQQAGLRLGSPATREGFTWMTDFMTQAEALNLRVDTVALHWYDWGSSPATNTTPTPEEVFNRFKVHLSNAYARYRKPLWITEFNANPNRSREIQDGFLQLALPYLEECGYVERYSYFEPFGGNGSFRDAQGELTSTGLIYRDHASSTAYNSGDLPAIWQTSDVGDVAAAGATLHVNNTFTVSGTGAGITGTADEFRYVYQPISGDVTVTARINSMVWRNNESRGGVMIRNDLSAGSPHALMSLTASNGAKLVSRSAPNGSTTTTTNSGVSAPGWVRLVKAGDTLTGYRSEDGESWTLVGTRTIAMSETVYVGLAVSSHNDGATAFNDVIFSQVSIGTPSTPPTLVGTDIVDNVSGGSVIENTTVTYTVTFSKDMNDSTVDASDFGNTGTAPVSIGTVTEISPGVFAVQATPTAPGTLQLQVIPGSVLNDTEGNPLDTTAAIIDDTVITVLMANVAPAWASNPVIKADATQDTAYSATLADDASDANGDPLTFAKVSGPGWLIVASDGTLSGTPSSGDVGANSFTVSVSDGIADPAEATLNISVNSVPAWASNPITGASATEESPYTATLDGSATDADGDPLTYAKVSGPAWLSVATNGSLTGTPTSGDVGLNSFTVSVSDGIAGAVTATLNITVSNLITNSPPAFLTNPIIAVNASEGTAYTGVTLAEQATDPDEGDTITFSKVSGPAWLVVASDGTLSGTPPTGSNGLNSFVVRATDSASATADATLEITVNSLPLPWMTTDIGTGMLAGSASFNAGTFTQAGSGTIGGSNDKLRFTYQTLTGDGEITARITSFENSGTTSRVGVMIRDSLATNSKHFFMGMSNVNSFRWVRRTATGGNSNQNTSSGGTVPNTWVRLVRSGSNISLFKSADGITWTTVQSNNTTTLGETCYIGLAVASGSDTTLNTSQFSNVSVTP